jgi:glutaredoxin-like protein
MKEEKKMPLLPYKVRKQVEDGFKDLKEPVNLKVFTQEFECPTCGENHNLMDEVFKISEKISIEVYDFVADEAEVEAYKIDKIPATVVEGKKDYGIRFYGVPNGYEFTTLIEAIRMVSQGDSMLSPKTRNKLKSLSKPVHIQVLITPTCPYCASAVNLAHRMAVESELITADMIETIEFPYLTNKYNVFAVPKVVINETIEFEGALPEADFLKHVMKAEKQ